jgi:hypothetical protein
MIRLWIVVYFIYFFIPFIFAYAQRCMLASGLWALATGIWRLASGIWALALAEGKAKPVASSQ